MASCPACGATINHAVLADTEPETRVPLEINTDASSDADRYRIVGFGPPLVVERVPNDAVGDYYPDHRFDCPDFNAGRTF